MHPNIFYEKDPLGEEVFRTLLALQISARDGKERVQRIFTDAEIFDRYYSTDTPVYRCLVSVLALCGAIKLDITDRVQVSGRLDIMSEYERMRYFLSKSNELLENHQQEFLDFYVAAFNVWMREIDFSENKREVRQDMYSRSKKMSFARAYTQLRNDVRTMKAFAETSREKKQ